jgi:hypothetical protein
MQEIGRPKEAPFRLDFFNVFEGGARALLTDFPVPGSGKDATAEQGHIVVVGLGLFGESLILQAAREWRAERGSSGDSLRVTVVDRNAAALADSFLVRYPWVRQVCELDAVEASFESREFANARFLYDSQDDLTVSSIFVCLDDDSRGISTALTLFRRVKDLGVPVVVRTVHGAGLASLLREDEAPSGEFSGLHAFGLLERMCNPDLLFAGVNEILARAMHEEYVRDQEGQGQTPETNPALVPWDQLEEARKESNRAQAAHIGVKLASVGCDLSPLVDWDAEAFAFEPDELERLAVMEHDRWRQEREAAGWTKGDKAPGQTTSPYLVPWEELEEEVRDLDRLFIRGLPRFLTKAGFQIVRVGEAGNSVSRGEL